MKLWDRLPAEIHAVRMLLISNLWRSPEHWEMGVGGCNA